MNCKYFKRTIFLSLLLFFLFLNFLDKLFAQENVSELETSSEVVTTPNFIKFNQRKWHKVRSRIEKNLPPYDVAVSTTKLEIPKVESATTIEFMEGTQLNIAGRKLIGVEMKETIYPNDSARNYGVQPTMKQELQVRIRGKVGNNVDVNVDIDDTQPDKRDISIVYHGESIETTPGAGGVGYKGKPGAVIQEAAFGDITLSLPNSEFVGYQRQVFGLKAVGQFRVSENRYGKAYFIASQSKGNFETKRFVGTTQFERKEILDISYIPRKYYRLSFGNDKIKKGSVKIYLDDRDSTNNTNAIPLTAQSYHSSTITYSGNFDLLSLGKDYVIDYSTGIIIFSLPNRSIQPNWVIAVDYIDENTNLSLREKLGTTNYILIKDMNDDFSRELKNRYSIGTKNIVRDNGLGNFILKIVEKSNAVPTILLPDNKPVPKYPTDIVVDFETGEFYFVSDKPFNNDCYNKSPVSRYNIIVEYRSRLKTYTLKPFLVPQSERVYVDGQLLIRDVDYFIDYDSGLLTFLKEEKINENSVIEVSYEYSMLGLQGGETLAGGRIELPLHQKIFVGGSVLGNLPSKGSARPDVRSTPSSLQVWETDGRIVNVSLPFGLPLVLNSLSAEYANSKKNPNVWNEAVVENMEGITLEDTVSTNKDFWHYGATLLGDVYKPDELYWENEDVFVKDINPQTTTSNDKQQVLKVNYDLHTSSEVALIYSFSKVGLDFTKKIYLDINIYSDGTLGKGRLFLDLGQLKEDIDNDNILDTEDKNNNGKLDLDEDNGYEYNVGNEKYFIGKNNGFLDSEDLDNDGVLKTFDTVAGSYDLGELNFTGWVSTRVFITVNDVNVWSTVKHIRLRVQGYNTKGTFKIAKISVVGNKWENKTPTKARIYAVNNENNKNYVKNLALLSDNTSSSMFSQQTNTEQALAIEYDFTKTTDYALCQLLYTRAHDFTFHHKFNFYIFNDGNEINLTLRAYRDDNNFVEYSTITALKNIDSWSKIVIEQVDINKDEVPETWQLATENTSGGICNSTGTPKLDSISKIEIIVRPTKENQKGVIYVNDMFLSESWIKEGIARKLDFDLSVPGWMNFGSKFKSVDRRFETFTSAVTNQDNTETGAYLNFSKIGFMPMSFQGKQSKTVTPSAIKSGNLVSQLDEGEVLKTEGSMTTSINLNSRWLPKVSGSYTKSVSSTTELSRTEIVDSYSGAINYSIPISNIIAIIPTNIGISGSEVYTYISPWDLKVSTPTRDKSRDLNFVLPFNFWNQLTLNFTAGSKNVYSELKMPQKRLDEQLIIPRLNKMDSSDLMNYWLDLVFFAPKNFSTKEEISEIEISTFTKQKVWKTGANVSLNIIPFFKPTAGYDISVTEDYKLPLYDKKDVLRNASGNYGVNFAFRNVLDLKPVRTLNVSYSRNLVFGDKYENLWKDLEIVNLYEFKNLENLWFEQTISTTRRTQWLNQIGQRASVSWKVFEGIPVPPLLDFVKKTDVTANYNDEDKKEEVTGTFRQTYTKVWPDINSIFYDIDKLSLIFWENSKLTNSRLDVRYTYKTIETKKVSYEYNTYHREVLSFDLFKNYNIVGEKYGLVFDTYTLTMIEQTNNFGWSLQVGLPFLGQRLTPKYDYRKDFAQDSKKVATRDLTTHTFSVRYYADIVPKQGIKLLWLGNIPLQNRLIIDTNVSYVRTESPLDVKTNNVDSVQLSSTLDYEVSRHIRVRLGGGYRHNLNRAVDKETNYSYNIAGQVTITF
jgi:hypothetical protein